MRTLLVAVIGAIGIAVILAAVGGSPAIAAAEVPMVKCKDCEGQACHDVYGAGALNCIQTDLGCVAWDDCG